MVRGQSSRRVALNDVAKRACVGTASVDRAINDRGNVRADVTQRVVEAARALGLKRPLPDPTDGLSE